MRVAAIDCGTNSIRLLVADLPPDGGPLTDVTRRMEIVRLGQGVDRTGVLAAPAIERTRVALAGYAEAIGTLGTRRAPGQPVSAVPSTLVRPPWTGVDARSVPGAREDGGRA